MENWEKLTKEIMRLIEANITATIDPEDNDGEPVLEIESSLEKSIGEIISSELESAKQEGKREERTAMEVFLNNRMAKEYASLHQNNNEQGGK